MDSINCVEYPQPGFSFANAKRNSFLLENGGVPGIKTLKTGTTICGAVFKDGVVVGADTRSTAGDIVCNKNTLKIHRLCPNMVCCGAGTSADCLKVTGIMSSQLELLRLDWNRQVQVATANGLFKQMLFRYQGYISAYLVLAGVDFKGPHLYSIHAHGSYEKLPFTALGSGMLAAMSILENGWVPDMEEEDAKKLVADAIRAGIIHDMGSGNRIDMAVLKANDKIDFIQPYEIAINPGKKLQEYNFPIGSTKVLKTFDVVQEVSRDDPMEN